MLSVQRTYLANMKAGRTLADKDAARAVDKQSHALLNKLRAMPENLQCFECDAPKPGWAVLPHGVFVCIDCAQLHRNLGRHISQTKAINTGTYLWLPDEIACMKAVGNRKAGAAFSTCPALPAKPTRDAPAAQKEEYVRIKYASGFVPRWGSDATAPHQPEGKPPMMKMTRDVLEQHHEAARALLEKPASPPPPARPAPASAPVFADLISFDDVAPAAPAPIRSAADANFFAAFGL